MSCAIGTDAGVAVDIAQISTSDSCSKCEKKLTQGHVGLQVISFSRLLQLSFSLLLIAGAVTRVLSQHCAGNR